METIREGDAVSFFNSNLEDYIFLYPTSFSKWQVTIPSNNLSYNRSSYFSSFQILPENSSNFDDISPLFKLESDRYEIMYGQKIKLRHVASKLYLSAGNENTLELTKSGEDYSTLFKIVSQMKKCGENVCRNDNVKLESIIKKGFYVLCFFDKSVNRFQLEMATISSEYQLKLESDISMLRTLDIMDGSIAWIQNVEINGLVVGSDEVLSQFSEVGLKQKTNGMQLERKQSVSCNCWWQIEAAESASEYNSRILPRVKVYIKHIVSEKYLKVNKEVTTVELLPFDESKKKEYHFYLVYYDQTKDEPIVAGSKIKILYEDIFDKMFLSIKTEPDSQKSSNGCTWHHLCLVDETNNTQYCCFKIDKVKPETIHAVYIMLGIKSFLQEEIQQCDKKLFDKNQIRGILTELSELTKRTNSNYIVKMLKSCMVLDLMIELLNKSKDVHLCNEISEVLLSFVQSGSPSTRKYLGQKFLNIYYEEFYFEKGVEKVLIELIRNESSIGQLMFEKLKSETAQSRDSLIKCISFNTLAMNDILFVDLLTALCQSGGKEVRDVICQDIIEKQTLYQLDIFVMENEREDVVFVKPDVMKGPIGCYCSIDSKCEMECNFLIAQLKLFSQLCKGVNNENCIGIIKHHVSFKQAVLILKDEKIDPLVQAAYLEVVTAAYIDKGVQNLCYCFLWQDLDSLKRYNAKKVFTNNKIHAADIVNFRKKDFTIDNVDDTDVVCFFATIKKMLRNNEELDTEEHYKNELLCQMLAAIETILENGYFWNISKNSDLDLDVLVNMLNGATDKYPEGVNRFSKKFHKTFFQVKIRLIKLLHIYFKKLSFLALRNFLCMFKDSYDHNVTEPDFLLINKADVNDMLKNKRLSNKQIRTKTNSLQDCFEFCHYSCFNNGAEKLTKVLIDLMYYDDEELKLSSAVLLFDIHQKERILFDQVQTNCYLHNPASKDIDMYNIMIKEGSCDESSNLKKLLEGTLVEDDIFKDLQNFFSVESSMQVNIAAQNVAYYSGIFTVLIRFVLKNCNKDVSPVIETHLTNACKTLEMMCCKNNMVKEKVFTHIEELLKATKGVSSVANLLTKVFEGNSLLYRCLSEHNIQQMYSLANNLELSRQYLRFYCTLEIIMKPCKTTVIKDNQNIIASLFYKNRRLHKLMNRVEMQKKIKMLVEYKKNPGENIEVLRFLCICNMLATACEGKCRFAEDICQDIFTLDDLVRIICSKDILLEHKTPFVRLLTEAYVATERPCHQIISQIMSEVYICLWDHINECVTSFEDCIAENSILQFKTYFKNCHIWSSLLVENEETTFRAEFVYMTYGLEPLITSVASRVFCKSQLQISHVCIPNFDKALVCAQSVRNLLVNKDHDDSLIPHQVEPHTTITTSQIFRRYLMTTISKDTSDDEVHINGKLQLFVRNYKMVYEWTPRRNEMGKDLDDLTCIEMKAEYHQNLAITFFKEFQKKLDTGEINIVDAHWDVLTQVFSALNRKCWCQISSQRQFKYSLTILQILFHYVILSDDSQCHEQCLAKALLLLQNSDDYYAVQIMAYLCVLLTNDKCDIQKSIMKEELITLLDRMLKSIKLATPSPTYDIRLDKSSKEYEDIDSSVAIVKIVVDEVETSSTSSEASAQEDEKKSSNDQQDLNDEKHSTFSLPSNQLKPCLANSTEQARVVLKLIAKLCDGQHRDMQNLLRYQEHSTTEQINIVEAITVLFQTSSLSSETILLTKDGIQALIEMCAGNHKNQIEVINNQVLDFINNVLEYSTDCDVDKSENNKAEILAMKCKVIELLEVLLEETDKEHKQICGIIARDLHKSKLKEIITKELYEQRFRNKDVHRALFRAYYVLKRLDDHVDKNDDEVWSYVSSNTRSIEVNYELNYENQVLSRVYFPFKETYEFTEDEKEKIQNEIKRDSPESKLKDLLEWSGSKLKKYDHTVKLKKKVTGEVLLFAPNLRHWILSFLTILLNVFLLAILKVPSVSQESWFLVFFPHIVTNNFYPRQSNVVTQDNITNGITFILHPEVTQWYKELHYIFGGLHLFFTVWMMCEYFVKELPNFKFKIPWIQKKLYNLRFIKELEFLQKLIKALNRCINHIEKVEENLLKQKRKTMAHKLTLNVLQLLKWCCEQICAWFERPEDSQYFDIYLFSTYPMYRMLFAFCSLLGLTLSGYFYSLCLPYIFINVDVIQHVIKAVGGKGKELIFVGLLILSIVLIYAVLSFAFMSNFFNPDDNLYCNTLWECYVTVIREGLLDTFGASIPVRYTGQNSPSFHIYSWRSFIDLSFFVIVTVIGMNVIVAILVDRFSELRSEKEKALKDQKDYCFICGIDSDSFEEKGFYHHYQNEHNMYNYIYYILYLHSMDPNDHNAIEKYVFECFKKTKKSIKFFPLHKAITLGGAVPTSQKSQQALFEENQQELLQCLEKSEKSIVKKLTDAVNMTRKKLKEAHDVQIKIHLNKIVKIVKKLQKQ